MKNYTLKLKIIFLALIFYLLSLRFAFADYTLPYPSYMPGHKLYRIHQLWEKVQEYWHFGNLTKFKYHLKTSDKYLVEAKTLFEYKQYLLALTSLEKSNNYFQKAYLFLQKAEKEGKKISKKKEVLKNASFKHKEVLNRLLNELPSQVNWREEKKEGKKILIRKLLKQAIKIRKLTVQ